MSSARKTPIDRPLGEQQRDHVLLHALVRRVPDARKQIGNRNVVSRTRKIEIPSTPRW